MSPATRTPAPAASERQREAAAYEMAARQREISVSEFFTKNRHLLGFDNPKKALLTAVKEAVDNSLDATEEAGIPADIAVSLKPLPGSEDRFVMSVQDNGPGIVAKQMPSVFGRLLYGSKFHHLRQARGQQGIGISAAALYGLLTTGKPVRVWSRISRRQPCHYIELRIDTQKNRPEVLKHEQLDDWEAAHGTKIEIVLEGRYQKGRQSVDDYLKQCAIANPHMRLSYDPPEGEKVLFERATSDLPVEAKEIRPHPYGVELGMLLDMMRASKSRRLSAFLQSEFSRVSKRVAEQICEQAALDPGRGLKLVSAAELERIHRALGKVKVMQPPTDCLSPIGQDLILHGLKKEVQAAFYAATTRSPAVYRGNPFLVEVGIAYGGDELGADEPVRLYRFANRVPLLYQQSACAVFKAATTTDWRKYGLNQPRGALPVGPLVVFVHVASAWVPFTSESKEAVAHYPEIIKEIRLALQECGREMAQHISRRRRAAVEAKKRSYIDSFIPHIGDALKDILRLKQQEREQVIVTLRAVLEKSRKA
ncbi:MAG: DNA topoisomerase VI subunit B [Planctomycetes bacterium]|nr:DNA topoisomerase VI subunit B [Planctomycetota bacterium]